jgi:hypothetical protein
MSIVFNEDAGDGLAFLGASVVPQSAQKRLFGGFSAPHFGHLLANGAPQSPQNFLPAGLSLPHFEQRINSPLAQRFGFAFHLSPLRGRDYYYVRVKADRDAHRVISRFGDICERAGIPTHLWRLPRVKVIVEDSRTVLLHPPIGQRSLEAVTCRRRQP